MPIRISWVGIAQGTQIYPEISAGKHRYSVRFMRAESTDAQPSQVQENVDFMLSRCAL